MNNPRKIEDKLIEELNITLKHFDSFEKAKINLQGDIIIKRKEALKKLSILFFIILG